MDDYGGYQLNLMHQYEDQAYQEETMDEIIGTTELAVDPTPTPKEMVEFGTHVAGVLKKVITDQKLYVTIQKRNYVLVEGWTTLGAMLGVVPRTVEVDQINYDPDVFEAVVELVRTSDGMIVGRGIAECGASDTWKDRDRYAKKSMAITRATGKAFRLSYSWIIKLAGYEGTPAEEMPKVNNK